MPIELTYLKSKAKEMNILFDKTGNHGDIYYEITEKMKDRGDKSCLDVIETLKKDNLSIRAVLKLQFQNSFRLKTRFHRTLVRRL